MHRPPRLQRGDDLAQGDATVVWRNPLVPIGAKARFLQALYGALGQVTVLEAAAGKGDARLAYLPRDGNNGSGKRIMELRGELADAEAAFQIREDGFDQGGPVELE